MTQFIHQAGDVIVSTASLQQQPYRILDVLGEGSSGITYRAQTADQGQVALKALSLRQRADWKAVELFEREAQVLAQLNHPAIPQYLDYFYTDSDTDRTFYIAQALAPGQPLDVLVQKGWRTTEIAVRQIAIQVLKILIYLHSVSPPVIHRDIKPQNLIYGADGKIFLVDFGAVQNTYHSTLMRGSTIVGTYGYMAPEQFRGQATPATDLYGLGATLLFLLTHRSPAELPADCLKINFRAHVNISEYFADWLEKMLEPDITERFPSAQAALSALQHPQKKVASSQALSQATTPWKVILRTGLLTVAAVAVLNHYKYPILSAIGFTPRAMYEGIMHGEIETVKNYLDKGINVNARDFRNHTLLHWAVSNDEPQIAALLIDRGANLHLRYDGDKHTVLHVAVQHDKKETTELLINRGANINEKDNFGNNALHYAISKQDITLYFGMTLTNSSPSEAVIQLLLAHQIDINARNDRGQTPLQLAEYRGETAIVNLLKQHGAH